MPRISAKVALHAKGQASGRIKPHIGRWGSECNDSAFFGVVLSPLPDMTRDKVAFGQAIYANDATVFADANATTPNYFWGASKDWFPVSHAELPTHENLKYAILRIVAHRPQLDDEQIGDELGIAPVEASRLLRELETEGLVRRL
jgi:hypothetical protein